MFHDIVFNLKSGSHGSRTMINKEASTFWGQIDPKIKDTHIWIKTCRKYSKMSIF